MAIENSNQKKVSVLGQSFFSEKQINSIVGEVQKPKIFLDKNYRTPTWTCTTTGYSCSGTCYGQCGRQPK